MTGQLRSLLQTPELEHLRADVCIVGSGPAGGIAAAEIARTGLKVLLLEAGPLAGGGGVDTFTGTVDVTGSADLPFTGTVQLGGSSNLWAGRIAPLEAIDFERRDWVAGSGWPITRAELQPHYAAAFRLLTGFDGTEPDAGSDLPPPFTPLRQRAGAQAKVFHWARSPFDVGRHLQQALAVTPTLQVLLDCAVERLVEDETGTRVDHAVVRHRGGRALHVQAQAFVLAAGGIETPRILLSSTEREPAGIGNERGLVGRYLSTHPKADLAVLTLDRRISTAHPLFADRDHGRGRVRWGLGFDAAAQRRHALLNHYVQLAPFLEYRANRVFEALRTSEAIKSPLIDKSQLARGLLPSLGLFAFEAVGRLAGLQTRARTFILRAFLDQAPRAGNRVAPSGKRNALGLPTMDVHWSFDDDDRRSVLSFLSLLDDALRTSGVGSLACEALRRDDDWPLTAIHSHLMGTTRMAADPAQGVVDADCKVFGRDNLYVSGPSVFTTYGYANPFLTITALALRLSAYITNQLGGRRG